MRSLRQVPGSKSGHVIATKEDLRRILGEYEGALQEAQDEGGEEADKNLETARNALLEVLKQANINLPEEEHGHST